MKPKSYDPQKIEKKWQKIWDKNEIYKAQDPKKNRSKTAERPKFYSLIEFPFPSGEGMHVGHMRSNTAMDIISRKRRMQGFNVLYPIGWDAFGLPTENYAIKTGIHPKIVTKRNTDTFRKQLKSAGFSFDWSREINTTDPEYYHWTQWIFLQMYKHGLAYKKKMLINWCPKDKIGLANEEVVDGCCERCGTPVEKREKEQWMLAITKYADRLDKDLDIVDYLERIKTQQRNWIGRSEGAEIVFELITTQTDSSLARPRLTPAQNQSARNEIKVFTTRPDTLFGATYIVLAPEHELVQKLKSSIKNINEVEKYIREAKNKPDIERTAEKKEKTGVELKGVKAINAASKEGIPVFIADYVLAHYGTGAIMAVPAHDERDFQFAKKYNVPVKEVIIPKIVDTHDPPIEGRKIVERNAVQVILIDPKTKKVLMLKWKKFPWTTFITGGIESGEDMIEAARREVLEETGYKNIKYIKTLGGPVESHFFAAHKNENRKATFHALVFELENNDQNVLSEEESAIHNLAWMTWKELEQDKNIKCSEYGIWIDRLFKPEHAFSDTGVLINSGNFNGLTSEEAKKKITEFANGKIVTTYKLRDWIFSRQHYWGEPVPMINCPVCGWVPVPEKELPVKLPEVKNYVPTDTGESPLSAISKWVNVKCPICKGPAKRETDTMPNWAGSSWYYLRYTDPNNKKEFTSPEKLKYWSSSPAGIPEIGVVDWYNGGMEHVTLHLLYSRFWHKFLFDIGAVPTSEPYKKRTSHGMILASNGEKMSKSKGNVVNPDAIIEAHGADTLRLYEMFMGPFDQSVAWSTDGIVGPRRFLDRVWRLQEKITTPLHTPLSKGGEQRDTLESLIHKTIKKVSDDIESMQFNTAVSSLMILVNEFEKVSEISAENYGLFLKILAPFAPHITEELWGVMGHKSSIHLEDWPQFDQSKIVSAGGIIVVQINGKVRAQFESKDELQEKDAVEIAIKLPEITKWVEGKVPKKVIYVKNRLINIVV